MDTPSIHRKNTENINKQYLCVNNEKNGKPGCPLQNAPSQLPDNSGCINCLVRFMSVLIWFFV